MHQRRGDVLAMTQSATEKKPFITIYLSIGGWKAVHIWWNPGGFWEPYQTGVGAYYTKEPAEAEAKAWAEDEGMEYRPYTGDL